MFFLTLTHDNDADHRIYGPRWVTVAPDGHVKLFPAAEPLSGGYEEAQAAFFTASAWMDQQIIDRDLTDSTMTLRGPNGIFRSHSFMRSRVI